MELMAIKLHRRLLNSTNGGVVHMHHGSDSFESKLIGMVVIAVLMVPVFILLVRLLLMLLQILGFWAARVVREAEAAEAAAVMEAARAAEAAAAQEAALAARAAAVVVAGLKKQKKHESCLLPTAVYKLDRVHRDGAGCECTICLGDFVDGEMVRVLPCSHRFHVGCIDKWLVSQVSCPNCRTSLLQHVINI